MSDKDPKINIIGIIGSGQMGSGIANVTAVAGYDVQIYDIDDNQLRSSINSIESFLNRQVQKKRISKDFMLSTLDKIKTTNSLDSMKNADLVIEAATENGEIKKKIFSDLCPILKSNCILATNTSSISITSLAATTDRPEKFIGLHFMNPVPIMKLVEIIKGIATNQTTFQTINQIAQKLGKETVVSEDLPGFLVNRILIPMINEAVYSLHEGVGSVQAIDMAMKLGSNHPMGPLELADFIGLDTCLSIMKVLHDGFGDSKYRPCPLLVKYVEAGWLGKKSGVGFYDYSGNEPLPSR